MALALRKRVASAGTAERVLKKMTRPERVALMQKGAQEDKTPRFRRMSDLHRQVYNFVRDELARRKAAKEVRYETRTATRTDRGRRCVAPAELRAAPAHKGRRKPDS